MKQRTRYLFIGLGAVFFLVAAPLVIFYVGGIRFDLRGNNYAQTGILSIVSDPKKTAIILDGKDAGATPANFRFLAPKEYAVTLRKDGYWDWSKRLDVKAGLATIASNGLDKIYLLKKNSLPQTISEGVVDFYFNNDGSVLVYLTPDTVNLVRNNNYAQTQTITLPPGQPPLDRLLPSEHGAYLLLAGKQNTLLLDVGGWKLTDISNSVSKITALAVTDSGDVLGLRADAALVRVNTATGQIEPLSNHVSSFTVLGQSLYFIRETAGRSAVAVAPVGTSGKTFASSPQIILNDLPPALAAGRLLVTEQKDVLLFSGSSLYKVNSGLDLVADSIRELHFDPAAPSLLYTTGSELYSYGFQPNSSRLITRSGQPITNPQISFSIGYAFFLQNGSLQALEVDDTDRPNSYSLLALDQGNSLKLDKDAKNLYILDGQKLETLNIR